MRIYDVAIVGAGIVGLATARALLCEFPGLRLVIVEKESDVAQHQTGHNSGVLHTGIYYSPGSQKALNCTRGRAAMVKFCEEENITHEVCGKVIVATQVSELEPLFELKRRSEANSVRAELIDVPQLKQLEPAVEGIAALHVPDAGIVDYVEVAQRLRTWILRRGATLIARYEGG